MLFFTFVGSIVTNRLFEKTLFMSKIHYIPNDQDRLRSYSSIFSSTSFARLLRDDDFSFITAKIERYDSDVLGIKFNTYLDYIRYIYRRLSSAYRNEYIYKNTLINEMLLKEYGTQETAAFNEFRVGNSVADFVLFNGISKVFEIKTELDSDKRLEAQLADYRKLFQQCYIVTSEALVSKYLCKDESVGVIAVQNSYGHLKLHRIRAARNQAQIDPRMLMKSLRTYEYKNVVREYFGMLPKMNSFTMFDICQDMVCKIPSSDLHTLFIAQMKQRQTNIPILKKCSRELRQLCLSMNISLTQYEQLSQKLNQPIFI